jgi:hypothetical protein
MKNHVKAMESNQRDQVQWEARVPIQRDGELRSCNTFLNPTNDSLWENYNP